MRLTTKIGERDVTLEANLGTVTLFQSFTGKNVFELITDISKKIAEPVDELKVLRDEHIENTDPRFLDVLNRQTIAINEAIESAKELAYVMSLQGQKGHTREDIAQIREQLNDVDYLTWLMGFEPSDFTFDTYLMLTGFWKKQAKETSEQKK